MFEKEKDLDLEGVGKQEGERGKVFIGYGKRRSTGIKRVRKEGMGKRKGYEDITNIKSRLCN